MTERELRRRARKEQVVRTRECGVGMQVVTSHDVARRAGVSQSAVSRVFTPAASVSAETAEKVKKAAAELGYRPNVIARSLITGRSRIVGLIIGHMGNQFYPGAFEMLSRELKRNNYRILVFMAPGNEEDVDQEVSELLDYRVDGIIIGSAGLSQQLARQCEERGIPVVLFNRHLGRDGPSSVTSNNFEGGRQVGEFLCKGGRKRIAHISGCMGSSTGRDRAEGFRCGLKQFGKEPSACANGTYSQTVAAEATRRMFDCPIAQRPDALFVGSDHMAFAAMDVLRYELGLRIPEDVPVIGYDDVPAAAWPAYDLTTVRQPLPAMVAATVEQLLERIENPDAEVAQVRLDCHLVVRKSAKFDN